MQGRRGAEFLFAVRAGEVLGLLMLVENDLVVKDLVAVVAERFEIGEIALLAAHATGVCLVNLRFNFR